MDLAIFYFYFSSSKQKQKRGRKRESIQCWLQFFSTSMISKRKGKALISLAVHDSRKEGGGLAPLERAEVLMYSYY